MPVGDYPPQTTCSGGPFYVGDDPYARTLPPVNIGPIQFINPDGTLYGGMPMNGTAYVHLHPDDMAAIRTMTQEEARAVVDEYLAQKDYLARQE